MTAVLVTPGGTLTAAQNGLRLTHLPTYIDIRKVLFCLGDNKSDEAIDI